MKKVERKFWLPWMKLQKLHGMLMRTKEKAAVQIFLGKQMKERQALLPLHM